jgi:hypothetical protein
LGLLKRSKLNNNRGATMNDHAKVAYEKARSAAMKMSALAEDMKNQANDKWRNAIKLATHVGRNAKNAARDAKDLMR